MTDYDQYIQLLKALANEERIQIIKLLTKNKEMCAQDVEKHFYLEQSTTSHHLNTLRRAGVAQSRRKGRHIIYSINKKTFKLLWREFGKTIFEA